MTDTISFDNIHKNKRNPYTWRYDWDDTAKIIDLSIYTGFTKGSSSSYIKIDNKWAKLLPCCIIYNTGIYKLQLAAKASDIIFFELMTNVCHPSRHPANYLSIDELVGHPYENMTQDELNNIFEDKSLR